MSQRIVIDGEVQPALPGEDGPLDPAQRPDPLAPLTDTEVLSIARRLARTRAAQGRKLSNMDVAESLPAADAPRVMGAWRLAPRLLMRVRAKASLEGVPVAQILEEALEAYASSSPRARVYYIAPEGGVSADADGPLEGRSAASSSLTEAVPAVGSDAQADR